MTRWTIRLAMICFVAALALGPRMDPAPSRWRFHRGIWTAGALLVWLHIAAAFQFFHDWSYAHAAEETSRRTAEVIGRSFGGEIWFNFAFAGLWTLDVCWRWIKPEWKDRLSIPSAAVQLFLIFIAFNATVVFEDGATRAAGIAASIALAAMIALRGRRTSRQ
jgi:hypothetical protein